MSVSHCAFAMRVSFFSILYFARSFSIDFNATLFFNNNSKMNLKNDSKELNLETAALDIHCNSIGWTIHICVPMTFYFDLVCVACFICFNLETH